MIICAVLLTIIGLFYLIELAVFIKIEHSDRRLTKKMQRLSRMISEIENGCLSEMTKEELQSVQDDLIRAGVLRVNE